MGEQHTRKNLVLIRALELFRLRVEHTRQERDKVRGQHLARVAPGGELSTVAELQVALATALQEKAALQTQVTELTACSDVEGGCDKYTTLQECIVPVEKTCQECRWWNTDRSATSCGVAMAQACDGWGVSLD